jgi:hypothetical protein
MQLPAHSLVALSGQSPLSISKFALQKGVQQVFVPQGALHEPSMMVMVSPRLFKRLLSSRG